MKYITLGFVAVSLTMCGPNEPPKAEAHPVGRVCAYTDVDGYRVTDYCHHLRAGSPAEVYIGLPGLRLGWGGGYRHHGWNGGGWRGSNPAPGIQLNFGGGRHGKRP